MYSWTDIPTEHSENSRQLDDRPRRRRHGVLEKDGRIYVTPIVTEAMVQAELYGALRESGIPVVLECLVRVTGIKGSRLDVAVLDRKNYLVAIIECKNYRSSREFNVRSKQVRKYLELGVPVLGCVRLEAIPDVVRQVRELLESA